MNQVDSVPLSAFLQYGAIGLLALLSVGTTVVLWRFLKAAFDRAVERGDRLEQELRDMNHLINDKYAAELVRATDAMVRMNDVLRDAVEIIRRGRR